MQRVSHEMSPAGVFKMEGASDKQIMALEKFAKNAELKKLLGDVKLGDLSRKEASDLIDKCIGKINANRIDKLKFSQNFKQNDGKWGTAQLSKEELEAVRDKHMKHCIEVMNELEEQFPDDRELQIAMFNKSADKVFTWIQQALDEKVRQVRK